MRRGASRHGAAPLIGRAAVVRPTGVGTAVARGQRIATRRIDVLEEPMAEDTEPKAGRLAWNSRGAPRTMCRSLTVTVPKSEPAKPEAIAVKAG